MIHQIIVFVVINFMHIFRISNFNSFNQSSNAKQQINGTFAAISFIWIFKISKNPLIFSSNIYLINPRYIYLSVKSSRLFLLDLMQFSITCRIGEALTLGWYQDKICQDELICIIYHTILPTLFLNLRNLFVQADQQKDLIQSILYYLIYFPGSSAVLQIFC